MAFITHAFSEKFREFGAIRQWVGERLGNRRAAGSVDSWRRSAPETSLFPSDEYEERKRRIINFEP